MIRVVTNNHYHLGCLNASDSHLLLDLYRDKSSGVQSGGVEFDIIICNQLACA